MHWSQAVEEFEAPGFPSGLLIAIKERLLLGGVPVRAMLLSGYWGKAPGEDKVQDEAYALRPLFVDVKVGDRWMTFDALGRDAPVASGSPLGKILDDRLRRAREVADGPW